MIFKSTNNLSDIVNFTTSYAWGGRVSGGGGSVSRPVDSAHQKKKSPMALWKFRGAGSRLAESAERKKMTKSYGIAEAWGGGSGGRSGSWLADSTSQKKWQSLMALRKFGEAGLGGGGGGSWSLPAESAQPFFQLAFSTWLWSVE